MKRNLILFFVFVVGSFVTLSQERISLTVEQAVELGLKNSKALKIKLSQVDASEAKKSEANAQMLPSLKFAGSYIRLSEVEPFKVSFQGMSFEISPTILNNYQLRLSLQQPLFTGFRLENNLKMMELNTLAAQEDYYSDENKLIADIKKTYWSLKSAQLMLLAINENIRQVEAHLQDLENFLKVGMATENELLKVQVQLSNLKLTRVEMENNISLAKINYCILLGLNPNTELEFVSPENTQIVEPEPLSNLLEKAFNNRPELRAMDYRKQASSVSIDMARAGWLPQIFLNANYNYNRPNQRLMPLQDKFYGTWDVAITFSYDIWNWMTTKHQTEQARQAFYQSELAFQQLKDGITLEVTQSYYELLKAKEKIEVAKLTQKQAEENFRVTNEKFKQGMISSSELLDAETALLNAKISLIRAYLDYQIAKENLEKSICSKK